MSNPPTPRVDPLPPPSITLPAEGAVTGPRTLVRGVGIPGAAFELRDIVQQKRLGEGFISASGHWLISVTEALLEGAQQFQATQTFDDTTSPPSAVRSFCVEHQPKVPAPVIVTPAENEQALASPVLSGKVSLPGGIVDVIDLQSNKWIASAPVDEKKSWHGMPSSPFSPGVHLISAVHRSEGKVSDYALLRSFSVRERNHETSLIARLIKAFQNALRKISSIWR